ncbi:putative DNA polymerase epsilon subunit B [Heterostelium album PN500]|uniref:DNA polymerase II subunit 2 n=1 Tax=Heterostelium pallidum (strain ATCC 26659 / Pp 5 / PN500) TaxID=670386 RepID=D3BQD4_HETP5|nr:putative DNA polymerase epsilon subunit B [Heterostelium album PN500]EFA76354.1 putative DNA polymerase epsilon subunit B [Heterostelium album PN500]|eukprot:XP_020428486.1 putative DNA polymerase epsilon subunit B [Heterostelium album PN500]
MDIQLKKNITKTFQLNGLILKKDAFTYLADLNESKEDLLEIVSIITKNIDKSTLTGNYVDKLALEKCIKDIKSQNDITSIESDALKVIDAFSAPLFSFDLAKRQFLKVEQPNRSLHGDAKSKADLFRRRYLSVLQRVERHQFFSKPVLPNEQQSRDYNSITPLNSLLGNPGKKYVLGTISQIEEGSYHIEDLNKNVPLDIENATFSGLVTENTIVQAYGELVNGVFVADEIMLPIVEEREESLRHLQGIGDMFGARPSDKLAARLLEYERDPDTEDNALVFLSDVWLDSPMVMNKLNLLFYGHKELPPFAFIFMGNFTEKPLIAGTQYKLKTYFDQLASLIQKYPTVQSKSKFIFIPGPTDPTGSLLNILPKFPIPDTFVRNFKNKISNAIFTTNPCRIRYCSQEIVIFRDDIVNRMRRHCIKEPSNQLDITQHLLENICSNSHLCNLPLEIRPIYWNFDHALSLYPLPNVLVLSDKYNQYQHDYQNTNCFNPSSFSTDFSFSNYYPAKKECLFCRVPDNIEELEVESETMDDQDVDEPQVAEDYNNPQNTSDISMDSQIDDENNQSQDQDEHSSGGEELESGDDHNNDDQSDNSNYNNHSDEELEDLDEQEEVVVDHQQSQKIYLDSEVSKEADANNEQEVDNFSFEFD